MSQKIKVDQIADLSATAAQLNFTVGVTASIQTQLDAKLAKAGGTMTGNIVFASGQPFSASDLNSGTLPDARFPSALPAISGANLTNLPAGGIASVAADTSPQLGGNLDVVTHDIVSTSNRNIDILPDGSGKVNLDGDGSSGGVSVSDGLVDIRTGTGSRSQVKFYCEVNNAHAQTIQPQPHSASVTNTLTLPAGGNQELVGTTATQTLTNKSIAASQLTGTIADARFPATLPAISGANLTNLPVTTSASDLTSGTLPDARFPATLPAISGANLTNLPAAGIANVVDDTSPELGGNLDVLTRDIVSSSNRNIDILPNGSGKVNLDGDGSSGGVSVSDGLVDIRTGTGIRSQVKFYCESSNAHAQTVQPQPHSAGVTNTLTLPAGGDQELVGTTATQTLTNKSIAASQLTGALPAISGASLTNLPVTTSASALTSGTLADARFPSVLPAISGANLTNLPVTTSASALTSGTLPDARFPSVLPAISGANLTNLPSPTPHTESVGSISGSTLNLASGNIFSHAPSSNTTYVFSSPPASGTAIGFTLKVSPSATVTLTWPTSVDWPGGAAPAAPASGQTDVFTFYTQDGGTTYYGFQAGNAMG